MPDTQQTNQQTFPLEEARAKLRQRRDQILQNTRQHRVQRDELISDDAFDEGEQAVREDRMDYIDLLDESGSEEIQAIDAALTRIDLGHYGECVECGEPIHPGRLRIMPETPVCRGCAEPPVVSDAFAREEHRRPPTM